MSKENQKSFCTQCGAEVEVNEKKDFKKILNILRGLLEDEEVDDSEELVQAPKEKTPLETSPNAEVSAAKPSPKEFIKNILGYRLINRLAIFLLAICMLALCFAPFAYYEVEVLNDTSYSIDYSGIDNVQSSLFSFVMGRKTVDSAKYAQLLQEATTPEAKQDLLGQLVLSASVYAGRGTSVTSILGSLLFVGYMVLCVAFVVVSGIDLVLEFFTTRKNRLRVKKCMSDSILCGMFCLLPALSFSLVHACSIFSGVGLMDFVTPTGTYVGWGAILSIILSVLGVIFVCASHSVGVLRLDRRYFDRSRIKHMIAIVLVILLMFSVAMPCLQVGMADFNSKKSLTVGITTGEIREMTSKEWLSQRKMVESIDEDTVVSLLEQKEIPEHMGKEIADSMLISKDVVMAYTLYACVGIVAIVLLLVAGVWLYFLIRGGFYGKKHFRVLNLCKVLALICVLANFLFALLIKACLDACLQGKLIYMMRIDIAAGIVAMVIFALLAAILRLRERRVARYVDEDYDNADVSYAPYVLNKKAKH